MDLRMAHSNGSEDFEVTQIIKQRRNKKGRLEYLVRWKNYGSNDDTWEPVENLRNCMDLLDAFNECIMREKGPFSKPSPPNKYPKTSKQKHFKSTKHDAKHHKKKKHSKMASETVHGGSLKRKHPFQDECKVVIKTETVPTSGNPHSMCNGVSVLSDEFSPYSVSSSSSSAASSTDFKVSGLTDVKRFHRSRSMSCVGHDNPRMPAGHNSDGSKRRRVNSLLIGSGDLLNTAGTSMQPASTTPPSTPTGSEVRLTLTPLLTPVIKLHNLKTGSGIKLPSPTSLLSTEKFLRAKLQRKDRNIADKVAGSITLRRLSQSSVSSEDEDETERRFSLRQCDNVFKYKEIIVKRHQGYTQVWFFTNSPSQNALNIKALQELKDILEKSAKDETKVLLLTGSGNVFCTGLDLQKLVDSDQRRKYAKHLAEALRVFINALINFPKVIVAAVNGRAVGLGAAILPLCDIVYSSDKAEFHLPYAAIGQPPEGCSSFTFPNAMGLPVACDLLYSGRRMTALEACASGLVSQVLWPTSFMSEVIPRVKVITNNSCKGLQMTKSLVRSHLKSKLEFTNESECAALHDRWCSSECARLIRKYLDQK